MADTLREVGIAFISEGERELLANIAKVDQAERSLEKTSRSLEAAVKRQVASEEEAIRAYAALERAGMEYAQVQKALTQDAKMLDAANQHAVNSMLGLNKASKSARDSARAMSDALRAQEKAEKAASAELQRHQRELEQLAVKYKPLYAASKQYERALYEIERAHELGVLGIEQHKNAVNQLQQEYQQFQNGTAGWENQFVQGGQRSARQLNRTGMAMQQFGYQAGDFLVQIQSGTNWMVAFGQQATQLAGLIGVLNKNWIGIGATLGIVIPLVTAIGAAWMRTSEEMDEAGNSAKDLADELKSLDATLRDFQRTQQAAAAGITIDELISTESLEAAEEAYDSARAKVEEFQRAIQAAIDAAAEGGGGMVSVDVAGLEQSQADIEAATAAMEVAEERLAAVRRKSSAERIKFVREERTELEANLRLQEIEVKYGSDSIQYMREQVEQERAVLVAKMEQERVGEATQASLLEIFDTTNRIRISNEAYTSGLSAVKNFWDEIADRIKDGTEELQKGYAAAVGPSQTLRNETEAYVAEMAEVFKQAQNLREELGDAAYEALRLSGVDITSGVSAAAKAAATLAANLGVSLSAAVSIMNLQESRTYSGRGGGSEYYGQQDYTSDLNYVTVQEQIDKYNKALERSAGSTKKAKEETSDLQKAMDEAFVTADEFAEELQIDLVDATGDVADAWADFVSSGFTDFKGFADDILGVFKKLIVDMIAMATRNRILIGLGLAPTGVLGSAGSVAGLAGGGGGGSFLGFGSGISALLGTGGGGLAGLAGSGGILGGAGGIASGLSGVFSGGGLGSSFANLGGLIGGSSSGLGALGAALPAAGLVLGGIALLSKGLSRKYAGSGIRGEFGTEGFEGSQIDFYKGGFLRSNRTVYKDLEAELEAGLDQAMTGMVSGIKDMAGVLGLGTESLSEFNKEGFTLWTNGKSQEEIMAALEEEMTKAAEGMAELILTTDKFAKAGETALETLDRLGGSLLTVNDAFDLLGRRQFSESMLGGHRAASLVELSGGADQFNALVTGYFEAFYTEGEKISAITRRMSDQFSELNLTMPETRDGFRDLVESQNLTTREGRETYASLLSLSGAFNELMVMTESTTEAVAGLTAEQQERYDLRTQLLQLLGRTDRLRERELELLYPGNRALQERIWLLEDEQAVQQERYGLRTELLQLLGKTDKLRERELAQLFPANQALQERIWALEDEQAAAEEAAQAQSELIDALTGNVSDAMSTVSDAISEEMSRIDRTTSNAIGRLSEELAESEARVDRARSAISGFISEIEQNTVGMFSRMLSALDSAISGRGPITEQQSRMSYLAAQSSISNMARGGPLTEDRLNTALSGLNVDSSQFFGSSVDYQLDYARTTNQLRQVRGRVDEQLTEAEQQVQLLRDTYELQEESFATIGDAISALEDETARADQLRVQIANLEEWRDTQIGLLEDQLQAAEEAANAALGIPDGLMSVAGALEALSLAISSLGSATGDMTPDEARTYAIENQTGDTSALWNYEQRILNEGRSGLKPWEQNVYDELASQGFSATPGMSREEARAYAVGNQTGDASALWAYEQRILAGARDELKPWEQSIYDTLKVQGFARGGMFGGGMRMVGEMGPELEVTGPSRIYSSRQTSEMMRDPRLLSSVESLRQENAQLRQENSQLLAQIVKYVKRSYELDKKHDIEGTPPVRT